MEKFIALTASGIALGSVLALVALGFVVLYKATGVINFAHGDLVTLAAYLGIWTTEDLGIPLILGYLLTLVIMFIVGVVLERIAYAPLRRQSPLVVVIATLAAAIIIRGLVRVWRGTAPHSARSPAGNWILNVGGAPISGQRIIVVVSSTIVVALLIYVFTRTPVGRQVRAIASDSEVAQLMGVRSGRLAIGSFVISAILAGIAGLLVAPLRAVDLSLGFNLMLMSFAAAVLGGFGSLGGVVLGGMVIGLVQQLGGSYIAPNYADSFPFILLFLVIIIRPQGLIAMNRTRL